MGKRLQLSDFDSKNIDLQRNRLVVSACLVGVRCRYNGESCEIPQLMKLVAEGKALPICPEQLGGLPTPRPKAEIVNGSGEDVISRKTRVVTEDGIDVTGSFLKGANEVLRLAMLIGSKSAILKQKSPSCGCGRIYNRGKLVTGNGVTTALLLQNGIDVNARQGKRGN